MTKKTYAAIHFAEPAFTNREEYLAWRTDWRTSYRALSDQIRTIKRDLKEDQRAGGADQAHYQCRREERRTQAREALEYRAAAKQEAALQMAAEHQQKHDTVAAA